MSKQRSKLTSSSMEKTIKTKAKTDRENQKHSKEMLIFEGIGTAAILAKHCHCRVIFSLYRKSDKGTNRLKPTKVINVKNYDEMLIHTKEMSTFLTKSLHFFEQEFGRASVKQCKKTFMKGKDKEESDIIHLYKDSCKQSRDRKHSLYNLGKDIYNNHFIPAIDQIQKEGKSYRNTEFHFYRTNNEYHVECVDQNTFLKQRNTIQHNELNEPVLIPLNEEMDINYPVHINECGIFHQSNTIQIDETSVSDDSFDSVLNGMKLYFDDDYENYYFNNGFLKADDYK